MVRGKFRVHCRIVIGLVGSVVFTKQCLEYI